MDQVGRIRKTKYGNYYATSVGLIVEKIGEKHQIVEAKNGANGFLRVIIKGIRNAHTANVHRLIAEAFVDNPNNYSFVKHKDGDKTNNNSDNLEWVKNHKDTK